MNVSKIQPCSIWNERNISVVVYFPWFVFVSIYEAELTLLPSSAYLDNVSTEKKKVKAC